MGNYLSTDSGAFLHNISVLARYEHPETKEVAEARVNHNEQNARMTALLINGLGLAALSLLGLLFAPGAVVFGGLALSVVSLAGSVYFEMRRRGAISLLNRKEHDLNALIMKTANTLERQDAQTLIKQEGGELTDRALYRFFFDNLITIANTPRSYFTSGYLRERVRDFARSCRIDLGERNNTDDDGQDDADAIQHPDSVAYQIQ